MNPKQFLQVGGVVLLLLGIVGFLLPSLFGSFLSFDQTQNIAHAVLGIVALVLAPMPLGDLKKWLVVLIGLVALVVGVMGFVNAGNPSPNVFGLIHVEGTVESLLYIVIAVWALWSALNRKA